MDFATAGRNTATYPLGAVIIEGKTKRIYQVRDKPGLVLVVSKDDITAGDGAKHDILPGKAVWATTTACNVFSLLLSCDVPVAFIEQDNVNSFVAPACHMLPYEVVVRREAHGSYLKRNLSIEKGHRFDTPIVELYLKTKNRTWMGASLECDDPLLMFGIDGEIRLYNPAAPIKHPFLEMHESNVFSQRNEHDLIERMSEMALKVFLLLEKAWYEQDGRLVDFKVEFGIDPEGQLLLADVIDNDSWRVIRDYDYIDKQVYRDGGDLARVAAKYQKVAEITSRFLSV